MSSKEKRIIGTLLIVIIISFSIVGIIATTQLGNQGEDIQSQVQAEADQRATQFVLDRNATQRAQGG